MLILDFEANSAALSHETGFFPRVLAHCARPHGIKKKLVHPTHSVKIMTEKNEHAEKHGRNTKTNLLTIVERSTSGDGITGQSIVPLVFPRVLWKRSRKLFRNSRINREVRVYLKHQ